MNKKYQIIYADPPWNYTVFKSLHGGRAQNQQYKTMRSVDIYNLPVSSISADDATLFLWATYPMLPEALYTLKAWGFEYKTVAFTWVKTNKKSGTPFFGMGQWTRTNAEICLLGVKGNPKRCDASVAQVVMSPIEEHSKKPGEVRDRIVRLMGDVPRVELFARQESGGWDNWGNELAQDVELTPQTVFGEKTNG